MPSSFSTAPALRFVLFFIPGILLQSRIGCSSRLLLLLLLLASIALFPARKKVFRDLFAVLCIFLCGALRYALEEEDFALCCSIPDIKQINIEATVLEQRSSPYHIESYVLETRIGEQSIRATLYARTDMPVLYPGKRYRLENVELQSIDDPINPYVFDYRSYAKRQGISHRLRCASTSKITELGTERRGRYIAFRVRNRISVRYLSVLGIEKGSLVNGLLLGMRNEIPDALSDMFRHLGISHLLAVSGLHVGLIVLIVFQLLNLLSLPRLPKTLFLVAFLGFYCQLTGGSPSVLRSSLMTLLLLLAPLFRRRYHALNAVASAAMILLLANPYYLQDLGFQFSFAAVSGILTGYQLLKEGLPLRSGNPLLHYAYDMLMVSAAASLFTAPVALYYFDTVQAASLVLNIVAIPLTFCVMICAMLCLPCLFLPGILGDLFLNALDLSLEIFRAMLRLAARTGIWTLHISAYWKNALFFLMLILLVLLFVRRRSLRNALCLILFFCGSLLFYRDSRPELVQLALPRGQSLVFRNGREALIVNTGAVAFNSNDYNRSIKPLCRHWGIRDLQVLITSDEKGKTGTIPHIRREYPDCPLLVPPGGLPLETPQIPIRCDTAWTMGDFHVYVKRGGTDLSLRIAGKKDTLLIGKDLPVQRNFHFDTGISPEKARHLRYRGNRWRTLDIKE
ncbi:MAG: ComEC/Rec2 family competence protein [Candidatus Marinimicrobia bacterium]|nr:ComEC/Rec2 family competence protein [Candidatus Neomarinimicrobiota bacterium]MDD4961848.1 ComEC/Rec2 family competence protein [Candidatus Neomarinimicrobiota bacterium]MDD5709733.1 ComEC/Rec2 family competence protein [Candidatus Neomarinimicrobiota bacterium]MDX9777800.1 ComEC/Rec2 family competence protein [bacterium]